MFDIKDRHLEEDLQKIANPKKYNFVDKEPETQVSEVREGIYSFQRGYLSAKQIRE